MRRKTGGCPVSKARWWSALSCLAKSWSVVGPVFKLILSLPASVPTYGRFKVWSMNRQKAGWVYQSSNVTGSLASGSSPSKKIGVDYVTEKFHKVKESCPEKPGQS